MLPDDVSERLTLSVAVEENFFSALRLWLRLTEKLPERLWLPLPDLVIVPLYVPVNDLEAVRL